MSLGGELWHFTAPVIDFQLIEPKRQIEAAVCCPAGWQVEESRELGPRHRRAEVQGSSKSSERLDSSRVYERQTSSTNHAFSEGRRCLPRAEPQIAAAPCNEETGLASAKFRSSDGWSGPRGEPRRSKQSSGQGQLRTTRSVAGPSRSAFADNKIAIRGWSPRHPLMLKQAARALLGQRPRHVTA
jgi:hypothetical protein